MIINDFPVLIGHMYYFLSFLNKCLVKSFSHFSIEFFVVYYLPSFLGQWLILNASELIALINQFDFHDVIVAYSDFCYFLVAL